MGKRESQEELPSASSLARALGFSPCFQNFDRELEDLPRVAPYRSNPGECALCAELELTEET